MKSILGEIKAYLGYCEKQKALSKNSIRAYRVDMSQFIEFLKSEFPSLKTIRDISKVQLQKYMQHLIERYAVKSCKRKLACIKAFFNHLEFEDIIDINPMRKVKTTFKEPSVLPKTLKMAEVQALLQHLYILYRQARSPFTRFNLLKSIAYFELLFATGMRVGELCSLSVESIDFDQACVRIMGKGQKERVVYIASLDVLKILHAYIALRNSLSPVTDAFFINYWKRDISEESVRNDIKKWAHLVLPGKRITPHMFRHTFASLLLEEGVDIKFIQELLGHSSIATTLIYLDISYSAIKSILIAKDPRSMLVLLSAPA